MDAKMFLGKTVKVIMDRPMGSKHPEWGGPIFDFCDPGANNWQS